MIATWLDVVATDVARVESARALPRSVERSLRNLRGDIALRSSRPPGLGRPTGRTVLIFDQTLPDPSRDSGSDRIVRIARMSAALGHRTVLASIRHRHWTEIEPTELDDIYVPTTSPPWDPSTFWTWVSEATAIWLERPEVAGHLLPVLQRARTGRRVIFSGGDLHHVRLQRQAALSGDRTHKRLARAYRHLEMDLIRGSDVNVAITPDEAATIRRLVPTARIDLMPNVHEVRPDPVPARHSRRGLIFVGNFRHAPNVDAVRLLIDDVMPSLWRTHPEVHLVIVGDRLPPDVVIGTDERVIVTGWVDQLREHLDEAIALVAPLRFGAGMKGKVGMAMANGLPVVTTSVGAEGMDLIDHLHVLVAEGDAFVDRCRELLNDDILWDRLSNAGQALVQERWSSTALLENLRRILEE